jgi:hypothetical protein
MGMEGTLEPFVLCSYLPPMSATIPEESATGLSLGFSGNPFKWARIGEIAQILRLALDCDAFAI